MSHDRAPQVSNAQALLNKLAGIGQKPTEVSTSATPQSSSSSVSSVSMSSSPSVSSSSSPSSTNVSTSSSALPMVESKKEEESNQTSDTFIDRDISRNELAAIGYLKKQSTDILDGASELLLTPQTARPRSYALLKHLEVHTEQTEKAFFLSFSEAMRGKIKEEVEILLQLYMALDPHISCFLDIHLPDVVKELIVSYLDNCALMPRFYQYRNYPLTIHDNIAGLENTQRTINTARLIVSLMSTPDAVLASRKDETEHDRVVKVRDHCGRWLMGTPLQIAAMTGEFNFTDDDDEREEKDIKEGYVELLWDTYPQEEARRQLNEVFPENWEAINAERMQPYIKAIEAFMDAILAADETEYKALEAKLTKNGAIEKFEKAFEPDPNQVYTSGLVFPPEIKKKAIELFMTKAEQNRRLGGYWSDKSDLYWVRCIGTVDANLSERDYRIARRGIGNRGVGASSRELVGGVSVGLGTSFYFGYSGRAVGRAGRAGAWWLAGGGLRWEYLCRAKRQALQSLCSEAANQRRRVL